MLKSVVAHISQPRFSVSGLRNVPTVEVSKGLAPQKHFVPSKRFGEDDSSREVSKLARSSRSLSHIVYHRENQTIEMFLEATLPNVCDFSRPNTARSVSFLLDYSITCYY